MALELPRKQQHNAQDLSRTRRPSASLSPGRRSLSQASSMIFERSVQDIHSEDLVQLSTSIPLHHSSDDFIPPVLDASCEVLTQQQLDPEAIQVLSLRHPLRRQTSSSVFRRSPSVSDVAGKRGGDPLSPSELHSAAAAASTSPTKLSPSSKNRLDNYFIIPDNSSVATSPTSLNAQLQIPPQSAFTLNLPRRRRDSSFSSSHHYHQHQPQASTHTATESSSTGRRRPQASRVLSFCSFADLVNAESTTQGQDDPGTTTEDDDFYNCDETTTSTTHPSSSVSPTPSSPPHKAQKPLLHASSDLSEPGGLGFGDNEAADTDADNDDADSDTSRHQLADCDDVNIVSLGETLRRNSKAIAMPY